MLQSPCPFCWNRGCGLHWWHARHVHTLLFPTGAHHKHGVKHWSRKSWKKNFFEIYCTIKICLYYTFNCSTSLSHIQQHHQKWFTIWSAHMPTFSIPFALDACCKMVLFSKNLKYRIAGNIGILAGIRFGGWLESKIAIVRIIFISGIKFGGSVQDRHTHICE